MLFIRKIVPLTLLGLIVLCTNAQEKKELHSAPLKEWYGVSGTEFIFSSGSVSSYGYYLPNKLRFSLFLHLQHQYHFNFNKNLGAYTGLSILNVGFINKMAIPFSTEAEIRQRSYSLSMPIALKFGNFERGRYVALGVAAELMFHYKRKVYYQDNKSKFSEWFSPEVNLFNPSLFAEIHFHRGFYIRGKSYLRDFLTNKQTSFYLPNSPTLINFKPERSSLAYISIGKLIYLK